MTLENFLQQLNADPQSIAFNDTIAVIDANYNFTPSEFSNGELLNEANQNNGSCKIFAFALLHQLSEEATLHCFGDYYRIDVLQHLDAEDHGNIRNFMKTGWSGIAFKQQALSQK